MRVLIPPHSPQQVTDLVAQVRGKSNHPKELLLRKVMLTHLTVYCITMHHQCITVFLRPGAGALKPRLVVVQQGLVGGIVVQGNEVIVP